jgi:hypothetical protein
MKIAKSTDGAEIEAEKDAPSKAICPYCAGEVILRGRRVMGSDEKSYFWRHLDNKNRNCPGRARSAR